jgi:AcrR family transcriptional regulator
MRRASKPTRERILSVALSAFRKKGFDGTTMRDVAKAAGLSLGAAYYYFPSKEAIVLAHWEDQMSEHERRAREKYAETRDLAERLRATYLIRLELMKHDKKLLAGLFRTIGDPTSPVSVFAKETSSLRARGVALMRDCVAVDEVPPEVRDEAALGLWVLALGFVLYFVHDASPGQARTRQLIEGTVDTLAPLAPFFGLPVAAPLRERIRGVLEAAGLWLPGSG